MWNKENKLKTIKTTISNEEEQLLKTMFDEYLPFDDYEEEVKRKLKRKLL